MPYKNILLGIYDSGEEYADRYTAVFNDVQIIRGHKMYSCLAMSAHPFHPQGFGQHSVCQLGDHLGKKISLKKLPPDARKAVEEEIQAYA